jgi:hypothetical protein
MKQESLQNFTLALNYKIEQNSSQEKKSLLS